MAKIGIQEASLGTPETVYSTLPSLVLLMNLQAFPDYLSTYNSFLGTRISISFILVSLNNWE